MTVVVRPAWAGEATTFTARNVPPNAIPGRLLPLYEYGLTSRVEP